MKKIKTLSTLIALLCLIAFGINSSKEPVRKETLPQINITIDEFSYSAFESKIENAIKRGYISKEDKSEINANLEADGISHEVKLGLKGDQSDHLTTGKWSFRIKTKKDEKILGLKEFSLQQPTIRGIQEIILLKHLRKAGVLTPAYFYVHLRVNDIDYGVTALEEHFTKELLESQGRKNGPIFALDESCMWDQAIANEKYDQYPLIEKRSWHGAPCALPEWIEQPPFTSFGGHPFFIKFKLFNESDIINDKNLKKMWASGLSKLKAYKRGVLSNEEIFDMNKVAKNIVITNLYQAGHGFHYTNIRFYYNPKTKLFEPISFDNMPPSPGVTFPNLYRAQASEVFIKKYTKELEKLKEDLDNGDLIKMIRSWEAEINEQISDLGLVQTPIREKSLNLVIDKLIKQAETLTPGDTYFPTDLKPAELIANPILAQFVHGEYIEGESRVEFRNFIDRPTYIRNLRTKTGDKILFSNEPLEIPSDLPYEELITIEVDEINIAKESYIFDATYGDKTKWKTFEVTNSVPALKVEK